MADVIESGVENVLAESITLAEEGNNACSEESKTNTLVESCNKNLSNRDSSSCERSDMANEKPKESDEQTPQIENIKDSDKLNGKDVSLNNNRSNEKKTQEEASSNKESVNEGNDKKPSQSDTVKINKKEKANLKKDETSEKEKPEERKDKGYSGKLPRRRSISPKFDEPSRSPRQNKDHERIPRLYSLSPQRYDRSSAKYRMLLRGRSPSPLWHSELEYRHLRSRSPSRYDSYYRSPERLISSPSRYDRYLEQFYSSEGRRKRSLSPLQYDMLRYRQSPRRYSRSPVYFSERRWNADNIPERHRSFSSANRKDENRTKIMSEMEMNLVPPGTEAELGVSNLSQHNRSNDRSIDRDVTIDTEKKNMERYSYSPIQSQMRSEEILVEKSFKESANPYGKRSCSPLRRQATSKRTIEYFFDERKGKFTRSEKFDNPYDRYRRCIDSESRSKRSDFPYERRKEDEPIKKTEDYRNSRDSYSRRSRSPLRRNSSPIRKLEKKNHKVVEKKRKSFLEEIEEKLQLQESNKNITQDRSSTPLQLQSIFFGTSTPQLNSNAAVQPGTSHQLNSNQPQMQPHNFPQSVGQHGFLQQDGPRMPLMMQHVPPQVVVPYMSMPINHPMLDRQSSLVVQKTNLEKEAFEKFFADKKSTYSECVHLAPKFADKAMNIQDKINAITRCQEAIKILGKETSTKGNFVMTPSQRKPESSIEVSGTCPFKKLPVVKFQFSSTQNAEEKHPMAFWLNRFLIKLGEKPLFDTPVKETIKLTTSEFQFLLPFEKETAPKKKIVASSSTQTEESVCHECQKRNSIRKSNNYSQTSEAALCFDMSCQVDPEDFEKPVRSILKKQSIMSLTPTQMLSAQNSSNVGDFAPKRQRLNEYQIPNANEYNPYDDDDNSNNPYKPDNRDRITSLSSSRLFSRDRPTFPKPLLSKSVPFSNFDHKLSLDFPKPFPPYSKGPSSSRPPNDNPSTNDNYWNRRK